MTCAEFGPTLSDLVDGVLAGETRMRLESHLEGCSACRDVLADLRALRQSARALPKMSPPELVWTKVRAAVDAEMPDQRWAASGRAARAVPPASAGPGAARPRPVAWWPAWGTLAAAAALLLAVSGGLYYVRQPAPAAAPQAAAHETPADTVNTVESELEAADLHYTKAIAALETVAKDGQAMLDPKTVAVLDKTNGVLDQAIRDSRTALRAQPTSEVAQTSLFDALQRKVGLLRDTIALINELRKGDQAGAAAVVGNLGKG